MEAIPNNPTNAGPDTEDYPDSWYESLDAEDLLKEFRRTLSMDRINRVDLLRKAAAAVQKAIDLEVRS